MQASCLLSGWVTGEKPHGGKLGYVSLGFRPRAFHLEPLVGIMQASCLMSDWYRTSHSTYVEGFVLWLLRGVRVYLRISPYQSCYVLYIMKPFYK